MPILIISAIWVIACAGWNIFEPRVPNWLTSTGLLLAALFRWSDWLPTGVIASQFVLILVVWGSIFLLWRIRWIGGGDAKFVMAVILAFPDWLLVAYLMLANIAGLLIFSIKRDGIRWRNIKKRLTGTLDDHQTSRDRLRATTFLGLGWFIWLAFYLSS